MGAARATDDPVAPAGLRRAYTIATPPFTTDSSSSSIPYSYAPRRPSATMAAAAAEAAALAAASAAAAAASAAAHGTSPTSSTLSVDTALSSSQVGTAGTPSGSHSSSEVVETLYSHPAAKILSFSAGVRNLSVDLGSSSSPASARSRSRRSLTMTEDDVEPGTLPSSSQFDRTIAVGALSIYRAPGSVAFLSCGSALQPILPKSQCWCIDEASSKFILQIRRPQYWRIELPVGDDGENDERARRFREVLDHVLQFEKTPCPFKRAFTVELPDLPSTPVKKKPWTPVKRPEAESPAPAATPTPLPAPHPPHPAPHPETPQQPPHPPQRRRRSSSPASRRDSLSTSPPAPSGPHMEFTRREWADMLQKQQQQQHGHHDEFDENGKRVVPALVAEHERIIMEAKASEIEVNKMGTPWRNTANNNAALNGRQSTGRRSRERALSMTSDRSTTAGLRSANDRKWSDIFDSDLSTSSSSPFSSIRSWLSPGRTVPPSSPPSSTDSLASHDGASSSGISSLFGDARRMFGADMSQQSSQPTPRYRHRATTSSISVSNIPQLPPAVNILTPARHLRALQASGRATTRAEAMRRIPGSIIYRVLEILLKPPSYLISLMLRVTARILSGEWRGFAMGTTDAGEDIPVAWDYTDVDDPLGYKSEMAQRRAVNNLRVYTEANDEAYTDAEDNDPNDDHNKKGSNSKKGKEETRDDDDDDDDDANDSEEEDDMGVDDVFSTSSSTPRRPKTVPSTATDDETAFSDASEGRHAWRRRRAVD